MVAVPLCFFFSLCVCVCVTFIEMAVLSLLLYQESRGQSHCRKTLSLPRAAHGAHRHMHQQGNTVIQIFVLLFVCFLQYLYLKRKKKKSLYSTSYSSIWAPYVSSCMLDAADFPY